MLWRLCFAECSIAGEQARRLLLTGAMMKSRTNAIVTCCLVAIVVSGCARTPPVEIGYYLPKSTLYFEVIRSVTCDKEKKPVIANTFIPKELHSADRSAYRSIALDELDGFLSNSNLTFEFYDDGRLKGINSNSVGRGREFIKSATSLAATLSLRPESDATTSTVESDQTDPAPATSGKSRNGDSEPRERLCRHINNVVKGKHKVLTLTYGRSVEFADDTPVEFDLPAKHESKVHADLLDREGAGLGKITLKATWRTNGGCFRSRPRKGSEFDIALAMREPIAVQLVVEIGEGRFEGTGDRWSGTVLMALTGPVCQIAIPKAALFGERTFELAVGESGAVTKIGYAKVTGATEVVGAGQDTLDAFGPIAATNAQTAALKAEADRIAAQQRLVRCRADPENCK